MNKTKNLIEKSENKEDIVLTIPALLELQKQIEEIKSAPNIFVGTEEESEKVVKNGDIWYEIIQN